MERRCWVNLQCRGVLLVWMIVGLGPIALAVGAGGGCLDIFSLIYLFSFLSPSLWETARCRLEYCLKGPLNPKQPTNQPPPPTHTHTFPIFFIRFSFGPLFTASTSHLCLVGCFGLNGPLRQYFSLYQAVSQREGERKEK